ncbi:phosphoenolpyruvate--protein phosphotransferase [Arthrobacter sp. CAN_C5]|uniref:phosphoenolpyruvate--protein phosphotransferase n=1 Tax=Arthrobacter sp. CAN_C5 TaxID=2760706 RepID=UPI001AE1877D|nr:phosphoenolpyruvate--protein phosphotransferase [Arthrobacter sp. CAN_C5]MBP2218409.1 phosphotransferase system enzyme I (PtsI) [Arthrobacter sp. CAN_C5]
MTKLTGVGVSPGRVIGPVLQMPGRAREPLQGETWGADTTAEAETVRLKAASKAVQAELKRRADAASKDASAVLEATAMMAADPMLLKSATKLINAGTSAERAVWEAGSAVAEMLLSLGGYMAERTQDVHDVRARLVAELRGLPAPGIPTSDRPFILAAEDLAPADTATLDATKVLALITSSGGPQSHTAILARALGLPAVVAASGAEAIEAGTEVYVDGAAGSICTDPGDEERALAARWVEQSAALGTFNGTGATADGHPVPLLANVGSGKDARAAAAAGAEGVGLLRTEFCFLDRETEPSPDEQAAAYQEVFDAFPGSKVVVRTLDAGADKPLPFLTDATEPNPALGVRGYRTGSVSPGVLTRQLKAIARAAADSEAEVWVMAPMISTAAEAQAFGEMCLAEGLNRPGVMVEVPSAALTSEAILQHVGFASLGTNDLTQYTMAADRQLGQLAALNDSWQPAVLQLVKHTVAGAESAAASAATEKPVGVCGEAAADPALAVVLVGLGVSTLSMSARALPTVAAVLASVTRHEAQELAALALAATTAEQGRSMVRERLPILETLGQ